MEKHIAICDKCKKEKNMAKSDYGWYVPNLWKEYEIGFKNVLLCFSCRRKWHTFRKQFLDSKQ